MSIEIAPNLQEASQSVIRELIEKETPGTRMDIPGFNGFFVTTEDDPAGAIKLNQIERDGQIFFVCQKQ